MDWQTVALGLGLAFFALAAWIGWIVRDLRAQPAAAAERPPERPTLWDWQTAPAMREQETEVLPPDQQPEGDA